MGVLGLCGVAAAKDPVASAPPSAQIKAQPGDADQTLRAMRDEMERSRTRLRMANEERPFYIEYRLLDIEIKAVIASFGALVNTAQQKQRFMAVDVRVGDYLVDSSNFLSEDEFRGFIGSTGQVGVDRDYDSLRQDLWLATDQAYKEALVRLSKKRAYIASLARQPNIPDFSREQPVVLVNPRVEPDWTNRNWEQEAKQASAVFRNYPAFYNSRVLYYLVYTTNYLLNSEGTQLRTSRSVAAIEASADTQNDNDGMRMHHFWTSYAPAPKDLPAVDAVKKSLELMSRELLALRGSQPAPDYSGPVLFEAPAAASLLAQVLPASLSGARPPLSMQSQFDRIMEQLGGRSEWVGRLGTRVLPAGVTLRDDPTATTFHGQALLGRYEIDAEGVRPQAVTIVEDGQLRGLLMSRRPGADFSGSNGHGRSAIIDEPKPALSNLFFEAKDGQSPADLRKKFLELCKEEGREWCVVVKQMDNPAISSQSQSDFSELFAMFAAGGAGDRVPLLAYKVYVADAREELMRGGRLSAVTLRSLRKVAGIGNDASVYAYFQNTAGGFGSTAAGAFGSAQGGLPSSVIAPSLLLEDVELRGARGEPRRPPLVPAPPLN
jgi:predicted Zn-dependent protease